ncbi:MAG: hypothetical protein ABIQ39_01400 [Ilumatobacteraceae bacterium]
MSGLQTEFDFFLPKGFVDEQGQLHRAGTMRLATARDELDPLRDPRVRDADDPFLTILVLSRVVTRLGTVGQITPREIENLFAADLAYLQDVYGAINFGNTEEIAAVIDDASSRATGARVATSHHSEPTSADVVSATEPDGDAQIAEDAAADDHQQDPEFVVSRRTRVQEVGRRQG